MSFLDRFKPKKSQFQNKPVEDQIRGNDWHWSHSLMLIGLFGGGFSIAYVSKYTLIELHLMWRLIIFFSVILLVLPYKWYRDTLKMERLEVVLANVLGLGPLTVGLLFWLNFLIVDNRRIEVYEIVDVDHIGTGFSPHDVQVHFADSALAEEEGLRIIDTAEQPEIWDADYIMYDMARGLFGFTVIKEIKYLSREEYQQGGYE